MNNITGESCNSSYIIFINQENTKSHTLESSHEIVQAETENRPTGRSSFLRRIVSVMGDFGRVSGHPAD